jgi:hypothetical protein
MQTSKNFSEEIMDFPAAGFAVASFVNPELPQPPSTTNPIFTPEANSPTPSAIEDSSFEENIFNVPVLTPSPTEMPGQDFSPDNLLGIGTKDVYSPTLSPSETPYMTPSPTMDTFIDVVKKDNGELICFKICTLIFSLIIGCMITYLIFFNKSSPKVPVDEIRTSGFGSTFDSIIDDLILNN